MALFDLLGRRATLRVLWELRGDPLTFRALQAATDTSPSVLNTRLGELREARVVEAGEAGYALTTEGRALFEHLVPMVSWADAWARRTP